MLPRVFNDVVSRTKTVDLIEYAGDLTSDTKTNNFDKNSKILNEETGKKSATRRVGTHKICGKIGVINNGNGGGNRVTVRQVKQDERRRKANVPPTKSLRDSDVRCAIFLRFTGEGHVGPYKPVPPPKPTAQTPPPYRMPPYPLYNEPSSLPGTALEQPIASSSPVVNHQGGQLQTHSNKFPIEREVILTTTDKNSKIPILNEYVKRSKGSIAPDAPPKQMAAWTNQNQGQIHQILPDQTHSGLIQTIQQVPDNALYRATAYPPQDYYDPQRGNVTSSRGWDPNQPAPRPYQAENETQQVSVQIEQSQNNNKDNKQQVAKGVTKTYHTLKDIISSRFRSGKDNNNDDKDEVNPGLNNVTDELRRSQNNLVEEEVNKKPAVNEQGVHQQVQYNQHLLQQHMLAHQAQQLQQHQQHLKAQQQYSQLAQARSQETLAPRADEQIYYQAAYQGQRTPQRYVQQSPVISRDQQAYMQIPTHGNMQYMGNSAALDRQAAIANFERRSAQQLERDNLRQRSFEARRAASQPQLSLEDEIQNDIIADHRPQPQAAMNSTRRGSYGNIMDTNAIVQQYEQQIDQHQQPSRNNQENQPHSRQQNQENEKDSDDGGFLKRTGSRDHHFENKPPIPPKDDFRNPQNQNEDGTKPSMSQNEGLQGTPRKKLEGEIGKIEGVYNVNTRTAKTEEPSTSTAPSRGKKYNLPSSAASSDHEKPIGGQSSSNVDSGRGSAAYSSGRRPPMSDIAGDSLDCGPSALSRHYRDRHDDGQDSEWVDIVENELRHILEPKLHELNLNCNSNIANSTVSESISSMTPPLPPLSPGDISSPTMTPKNVGRYKHSSLPYGGKPDYESYKSKHARELISGARYSMPNQKHRSSKKVDHNAILRGKQIFGLDTTDLTSTTTRSLDLESMLDGTESDGDLSTTDARVIRKQLEGLESMYSEVLKLLGVKQSKHGRYQPSDPKLNKRRYGSMSSLPSSSVSSRVPVRDRRGLRTTVSDERKKVRDLRGINRRFQRLEAHVVTLARSVAHLSSEMRTQHLMIQEMETIRQEIATLRAQTNMLNVRSQSVSRAVSSRELPTLANPSRVKKLTKFFGDEPPLLRLFLRKLGYEKYANAFENERVGMVELPYMTEERLQKMGVPMGPRLRIMQEAQISVCKDNTLCVV